MSRPHVRVLLTAAVSLWACGGSGTDSTAPTFNEIRVVAGGELGDTVLAKPLQALVTEVLEGGKPVPGLVVRFESLPSADTTRRLEATVLTSNVAQNTFTTLTNETTNASGRASVLVQLGTIAGEVRLRVSAPELGLADTVRFTVRPGGATKLVMTVRDTLLAYGGSYAIGAATADRYGNRRTDALTYSSGNALASVDPTGRVEAGQTTGRGLVIVRSGSAVDSARFTVIPLVNLAFVFDEPTCCRSWLADGRSDGSSVRKRLQVSPPTYPSPSPTGDSIVFQRGPSTQRLFVIDASGTERDLLQGSVIEDARFARYSADGTYIYFGGLISTEYAVWRVHPDGSGLERIVTTNFVFPAPGISPDGKRIAYSDGALKVREIATGATVTIAASGASPVFSPDGGRVAYLTGSGVVVVNSDGTSARSLTDAFVQGGAGLAWLPDGQWLITRDYCCAPLLMNASTGEVLPLPWLSNMSQIAVRP